jgi:hypothetical protein
METRYDLLRALVESPIFKRRNDDSDWMLRNEPLRGVDTRVTMAILSKGSTPNSIKIHMLVDICGAVKVMKTVVIDTTDDITSVYVLDSRYRAFDRELIDVVRRWLNQQAEDDMIYDESFLSLIDGGSGYKYLRLVAWVGASVCVGFCVFCTWMKVTEFFAGL